MPTAPQFEWPQGEPLFETQWRAVTESLAGNGVVSSGDLALTPGTNNREVDYAAGTVYYIATEYDETAGTVTVSAGDANNDRWDTIAYDTATPGVEVKEGTPAANPEPPDIDGDEVLLGVVYVPQNFDDVLAASQVLNWQGRVSNEAEEVHYNDNTGVYSVNNVDAALDELQEAAQISAYPIANSDLNNSTIDVNAGTALATTNASIGLGGSATLSVPENGITLTELNAAFALQDITDGDLGTGDLTAESGAFKVFDNTADWVPRPQVEDELVTNSIDDTDSPYVTSGEEVVLVDSSAGAVTVQLATADLSGSASRANFIQVIDVGGNAETNNVTVETEGTETIDGETSKTIRTDYGSLNFASDGSNWFTAGGASSGPLDKDEFSVDESGTVAAGNAGVVFQRGVPDGQTFEVVQASLMLADGQAAPTDLDLVIATLDNAGAATVQATIIAGDGTVKDNERGDPLASYSNTSGAAQTVAVFVDNGNFNAGTGSSQDIAASARGEVTL